MARISFKGRQCLVTGGSSGIGLDIAKILAKEGCEFVLVGSSQEKLLKAGRELESESGRKPVLIAKDLSEEKACFELMAELRSGKINVDILVNSAGFGVYGEFHTVDLKKSLGMINVNVKALVILTYLCIPSMIEKKSGFILNIASTAGFQGIPREAIYASSKAFVVTFSEALTEELKNTGVHVTCLCPGATRTPFFTRGDIFPSTTMKRNMMSSEEVARIGVEALRRRKPLEIAGIRNKALIGSERLIPRKWATKIAGRLVK